MGEYGIDPHSPYSLYDVLEEDQEPGEFHCEYHGFHIVPQGNGRYHVQYDGHAGSVMDFDREEYGDVLELVADLNDLVFQSFHYDYQDEKEDLVEWAGKIMTDDAQKADENPDLYIKVPENPPPV